MKARYTPYRQHGCAQDASVSTVASTNNLRLRKAPICLAPSGNRLLHEKSNNCRFSRPRYALCYRGISLVSYNRYSPTNCMWRACPATLRPAALSPAQQRWGGPFLPSPMFSASRATQPKAWTPPSPPSLRPTTCATQGPDMPHTDNTAVRRMPGLPSTSPPGFRRRPKQPRV